MLSCQGNEPFAFNSGKKLDLGNVLEVHVYLLFQGPNYSQRREGGGGEGEGTVDFLLPFLY